MKLYYRLKPATETGNPPMIQIVSERFRETDCPVPDVEVQLYKTVDRTIQDVLYDAFADMVWPEDGTLCSTVVSVRL